MVNWSSPAEIAKDQGVFEKLVFALFGVYLWELVLHCDFDWSFVAGRRSFRWPLVIFFFLCRYCMLFSFIGLIISLTVTAQINCRALYTFNSWTGNMTILCASTSLMFRTIALWDRKKHIIAILGVLCLAHWGLLYRTMFIVTADWDPVGHYCAVTQTSPSLLNVTFFFTMGFDLVILIFTALALIRHHTARTDLWKLLFHDGLVYFLVSFSMNCIPAVLNVLNLNPLMNVMATVPAAAITSIAACRAVIRLMKFSTSDPYVHSAPHVPTKSNNFRRSLVPNMLPAKNSNPRLQPKAEVHIQTELITMTEFPLSSPKSAHSLRTSLDNDSSKTGFASEKETV